MGVDQFQGLPQPMTKAGYQGDHLRIEIQQQQTHQAFEHRYSVFSENANHKFSNIPAHAQNPIRWHSHSAPKVKLSKQEQHTTFNTKAFTNAVFATVTVLSLGVAGHAASAQPTLVIRGPHGAASIVNEVPLGATVLPTAPSHDATKLVTRGPGGAAQIVGEPTETKTMAKAHSFPKLVMVGSHGAIQIIE